MTADDGEGYGIVNFLREFPVRCNFGDWPFLNGGDATKQIRGIADGFGWGRRSNICNKYLGVALASFAAAISGTIDSGGVRRLRLKTLFFDLAVVAQQTTCVSAMPRDHFGCASWRDKNATKNR